MDGPWNLGLHYIADSVLLLLLLLLTLQVTANRILTLHRATPLGETQTKREVLNRRGARKTDTTETKSSANKSFATTGLKEEVQHG